MTLAVLADPMNALEDTFSDNMTEDSAQQSDDSAPSIVSREAGVANPDYLIEQTAGQAASSPATGVTPVPSPVTEITETRPEYCGAPGSRNAPIGMPSTNVKVIETIIETRAEPASHAAMATGVPVAAESIQTKAEQPLELAITESVAVVSATAAELPGTRQDVTETEAVINHGHLKTLSEKLFRLRRNSAATPVTVIDWTTTGIILCRVESHTSRAEVRNSAFEPWPPGFDPLADPEQTGLLLKEMLTCCPWAGRPVAVSVPRQMVSLRLMQLPNVSREDLPALISLQMEARQTSPENAQTWDFVAHTAATGEPHCFVSVVSIPTAVCRGIQAALEVAGWKTPILTAADLLISRAEKDSCDGMITVQANRSKLEVVAMHGGFPAASIATSAGNDQALPPSASLLLSLIERVTESLPEEWRAKKSRMPIMICGSRSASLSEILRSEGHTVIEGPADERSPRALAMVENLSVPQLRLNFLKPRSAPASFLKQHRPAVRLSLISSILAAGIAFVVYDRSSELQKTLEASEKRLKFLEEVVQRGETTRNRWAEVEKWNRDTLNAATELQAILQMIPSREQMILTRVQLENMPDSEERVLRLEGIAQTADEIRKLNEAVLSQPERFALRPHGIEPAPIGSPMPISFRFESQILQNAPQPAEQPIAPTEEIPVTSVTETEN
ncbi:MAG: hypothetical protein WCK86_03735 [Planctomycetia bacterium]